MPRRAISQPNPSLTDSRCSSDSRWRKIARLPGRDRSAGSASRTVTRRPSARTASAAVKPTGPAPTTSTCCPSVDRKSTRLNSSHLGISYAVFCLKKKNDRALFGEKYGDEVRVVAMGRGGGNTMGWSVELCCGKHVRRNGDSDLIAALADSACSVG